MIEKKEFAKATKELLWFEQKEIALDRLHDVYTDELNWLSQHVPSPVPGGTSFHGHNSDGKFASFNDRWDWVESVVLPEWEGWLAKNR